MRPVDQSFLALIFLMAAACAPAAQLAPTATAQPLATATGSDIGETDISKAIWYDRNGVALPSSVIVTFMGPAHCDWETATFLHVGWPLGTLAETMADARQYVHDPNSALSPSWLRSSFDGNAKLPKDAVFSGFHTGDAKLWTSPSDVDVAVYLLFKNHAEKWPRSDPLTLCV